MGRGDELVGVRLDADGDPDHDRYPHPELVGEPDQPVDLGERVDDDPADAILDRGARFGEGLVVAVHPDPLPGEADPTSDLELAAAADVEVQPSSMTHWATADAEEGLPGVVDVGPGEPLLEGAVKSSRKARARSLKSCSSITYAGVPNVAARSVVRTPATVRTPSGSRSTPVAHSCGSIAMTSDGYGSHCGAARSRRRGGTPASCERIGSHPFWGGAPVGG